MRLNNIRHATAAVATMGIACLSSCGPAPQAAAPNLAVMSAPAKFTLDTPVEKIAADPAGKAVLNRDLPGLLQSPSYVVIEGMSVSQIATMSNGRITQARLEKLQADLAALPPPAP